MLKIVQAPNEVLSKTASQVDLRKINSDIAKLVKEMGIALAHASDPKGVGLAAPQVGSSLSLFITKPTDKAKVNVFINPKIVSEENKPNKKKGKKKSGDKKLEGCLSLKDIWGEVKRPEIVTLEYFDEKGIFHTKKIGGFMATIVQHEVDHLNGVLFPKRVLEQRGKLYKSSIDEEGDMIFDPIEI
jgi:peptide deformylase